MKMGDFEKRFVNSDSHSQRVGRHAEELLRLVDPEPREKYLDVGCGNGAATVHVARTFGLNATGVDIDPEQIEAAQANSRGNEDARFMTLDATRLPFPAGEFDIVFTHKVTHHIPNWGDAIAEMVRVLKPGGYLIYSDFVLPGLIAALGRSVIGERARLPTRAALAACVEKHDLSAIHESGSLVSYEVVFRKGTA